MTVLQKPFDSVTLGSARSTFYHSDCLDVFAQLPARSVDVIVTSPPYNLGIQYNQYQDTLSRSDYLQWTNAWVAAAARVLRPEGSLFLNVGAKPTDPWTALDVAQAVRPHLQLQNIIHWVKSIAIERSAAGLTRDLAVGHYKPINSDRFVNDCHEFIFHFTPRGSTSLDRLALGVPYQDQSNVGRWRAGAKGVRCRGNTWFIPYETIQRRDRDRPHPATFPSRLPEQCLRLHGLARTEVVMDPFMGLGSTAVACARVGVGFIGAELDEAYLKVALERTSAVLVPSEVEGRDARSRGAATRRELPARGTARMRKAELRDRPARQKSS